MVDRGADRYSSSHRHTESFSIVCAISAALNWTPTYNKFGGWREENKSEIHAVLFRRSIGIELRLSLGREKRHTVFHEVVRTRRLASASIQPVLGAWIWCWCGLDKRRTEVVRGDSCLLSGFCSLGRRRSSFQKETRVGFRFHKWKGLIESVYVCLYTWYLLPDMWGKKMVTKTVMLSCASVSLGRAQKIGIFVPYPDRTLKYKCGNKTFLFEEGFGSRVVHSCGGESPLLLEADSRSHQHYSTFILCVFSIEISYILVNAGDIVNVC